MMEDGKTVVKNTLRTLYQERKVELWKIKELLLSCNRERLFIISIGLELDMTLKRLERTIGYAKKANKYYWELGMGEDIPILEKIVRNIQAILLLSKKINKENIEYCNKKIAAWIDYYARQLDYISDKYK